MVGGNKMIGYKAFDKDLKCRDMQAEAEIAKENQE